MNMSLRPDPSREDEIRREIENFKDKRKRIIATLLIGLLGIYILPFRNLTIVLAIISLVIAPIMIIYYSWKKSQLEKMLEEENLEL